jgi:DNA-binding response OmpR family regulator
MTEQDASQVTESGQSAHVFVVDDEDQMCTLFKRYLSDSFRVSTETRGARAVQRIDDSVDVVLLDRRMPDLSGEEILGILREEGFRGKTAIVTSLEFDQDIAGKPFDEYIEKPVSQSELTRAVEVLVEEREFERLSRQYFQLKRERLLAEEDAQSVTSKDVDSELDKMQNQLMDLLKG